MFFIIKKEQKFGKKKSLIFFRTTDRSIERIIANDKERIGFILKTMSLAYLLALSISIKWHKNSIYE